MVQQLRTLAALLVALTLVGVQNGITICSAFSPPAIIRTKPTTFTAAGNHHEVRSTNQAVLKTIVSSTISKRKTNLWSTAAPPDRSPVSVAEHDDDDEDDILDEGELLAAIDEAPVGSLSVDQVDFLRDMMQFLVHDDDDDDDESEAVSQAGKKDDDDEAESAAPLVERLLFRLLDEWHAAIDDINSDSTEDNDNDNDDEIHRAAVIQPTLKDFTLVFQAWEKDTLLYSSSRRKSKIGQEAVGRVSNLLGILQELWEGGGVETLKPNQQILEIVLRVLASSRDRGMDRRAYSILESVRDENHYGFEPTCDMYQSVILSLGRSKGKGSPQRAETLLKEAVEKFPPHIDPVTGKPGGVPIETFNKVLVAWAKSRDENGPERAEELIVYMDDLDRDLDCGGAVKPNLSSFTTLIDAYAQTREWDGVSCSERIFNRVLDHYLEGIVKEEPNIASWTIVISAWSRLAKKNCRGAEERAAKLLKRMESLHEDGRISFGPDAIAMTTCLNAWAFSKNKIGPTHAEMLLDEMHERYMDGDDSMKPSIRSIQVVIDAWTKLGEDEGAMEQAEVVLDRYEDHLYSLGPPEGPPEVLQDIADIYRSMLFGWTKCDTERAQDYLLDMVDRKMQLDSFCFDKIIEADTRRLPEDPNAMKRIQQVFEVLEKCRKSDEVKPNERVYTSFIRALTRAKEKNLAKKSYAILQRMNTLYEEGNRGIKPTVFTYNAVLNACAETLSTEDPKPMEAFKIALQIFNDLRSQREGLDHVSFGNMLKCANLLPEGPQKDKFIATTFKLCCDRGLVNTFVVRDLQGSATEDMWRELLGCPQGEVDVDRLPREWSATVSAKQNKKKAGFEKRGGFGGKGRSFRAGTSTGTGACRHFFRRGEPGRCS